MARKKTAKAAEEVTTEENAVATATFSLNNNTPIAAAPLATAASIVVEEDDDVVKIPDDLHLDKNTHTLYLDGEKSVTLKASLEPSDSDGAEEIKWEATPSNLVEITPTTGMDVTVTAKEETGVVTIKASYVDVDDECTITIKNSASDPEPEDPKEEEEPMEPEMTEYEKLNTVEARRSRYELSSEITETVNGKKVPEFAKRNTYRIKKVLNDRAIIRAGLTYTLAVKAEDIAVKQPEPVEE